MNRRFPYQINDEEQAVQSSSLNMGPGVKRSKTTLNLPISTGYVELEEDGSWSECSSFSEWEIQTNDA